MSKYNSNTLRSEHGDGYYTIISDDIIIPWKPLSIGEFIKYETLFNEGVVNTSVLEDEVFRKCVTDPNYVRDINFLNAGIIGIVVQNIFSYSGPSSIDDFNNTLNINRQISDIPFHFMAPLVVRAFPSYKLEDVYAMPYEVFMLRLAQAESLLMRFGVIKDHLVLKDNEPPKKKPKLSQEDLRTVKEKWEKGQIPVQKNLDDIRMKDEQASGMHVIGDESELEKIERARMIKEAQAMYKDIIPKLPHYKEKG